MNNLTPNWQSSSTNKPKTPKFAGDSILESIRDLSGGVGKTITNDLIGKVAIDSVTSIFTGGLPKSGELKPNQTIDFSKEKQIQRPQTQTHEYLQPRYIPREEVGLKDEIAKVRMELASLAQAVKNFNSDIEQAINTHASDEGIYHLNFLNRLRIVLRSIRENIEDSSTWLRLTTGRKKQKGYWSSYKKHGTQFGLSSERTMATQAG